MNRRLPSSAGAKWKRAKFRFPADSIIISLTACISADSSIKLRNILGNRNGFMCLFARTKESLERNFRYIFPAFSATSSRGKEERTDLNLFIEAVSSNKGRHNDKTGQRRKAGHDSLETPTGTPSRWPFVSDSMDCARTPNPPQMLTRGHFERKEAYRRHRRRVRSILE